jgi:hypothetical protein
VLVVRHGSTLSRHHIILGRVDDAINQVGQSAHQDDALGDAVFSSKSITSVAIVYSENVPVGGCWTECDPPTGFVRTEA